MKKKILAILFIPYLVLMLIESCYTDYCVRRETREITNILLKYEGTTQPYGQDRIYLYMEYNSYFVSNFYVNILNKSMAKSIDESVPDPCFDGFLNSISGINISSSNDFDTTHRAGSELNSLFIEGFSYDTVSNSTFEWDTYNEVQSSFDIYNIYEPNIDSIHTLYFEVDLDNGTTYFDTLTNVNLNRTYNSRF